MYRLTAFVLSVLMLVPLLFIAASASAAGTVTLQVGGSTEILPTGAALPTPDAPDGKVFVGWAAQDVLLPAGATYTPSGDMTLIALFLEMQTRFELRLGVKNGIRFLTDVDRADWEALLTYTTPTFGTLIAPRAYVEAADGVLTPEALTSAGKTKYLNATADEFYGKTDTVCTFAGSIVAFLSENLTTDYVGAGYVKITYTNGTEGLIAAAPSGAANPYEQALTAHGDRTAQADATHKNAVGDRYSPYTAAELHYFSNILSGCIVLDYKMTSTTIPPTLQKADDYHQLPYIARYDEESESVILTVTEGSDFRFSTHFCSLTLDGYDTTDSWNDRNLTFGEDGTSLAIKYREYTD